MITFTISPIALAVFVLMFLVVLVLVLQSTKSNTTRIIRAECDAKIARTMAEVESKTNKAYEEGYKDAESRISRAIGNEGMFTIGFIRFHAKRLKDWQKGIDDVA